jgi:hypothetical protein
MNSYRISNSAGLCLLLFFLVFIVGCIPKDDEPGITPLGANSTNLPTIREVCGGWDNVGEVICTCDGEYIKERCPPGVECEANSYLCKGACHDCMCYLGPASNNNSIECDGRDEMFN